MPVSETDGPPAIAQSNDLSSTFKYCPQGPAIKTGEGKQLAFIVGVGDHKNTRIPSLKGASADALRIYSLLTQKNGFGFPKGNVCLLLDKDATRQNVLALFEKTLLDRVAKNDTVLFYYAGHGSQSQDHNFDEADGLDETFVLYDSRTISSTGDIVGDLSDDSFNGLLAKLNKKTKNITVVLDSCNSGTATRSHSELVARYIQPDSAFETEISAEGGAAGESAGWVPEDLPGLVTLTAAVDGSSAWERRGEGIFTSAFIEVLSQMGGASLTYRQLARQITTLVKASSSQIVQFHGDLDRTVFASKLHKSFNTWEVLTVGSDIIISGPPMPGMTKGAELRVYSSAEDIGDLGRSKAALLVTTVDGFRGTAKVIRVLKNADKIVPGDLVFLVRSAAEALNVRLRPKEEHGGLSIRRMDALKRALVADPLANELIDFSESGEFELSANDAGALQLMGPENRIRIRYKQDSDVIDNLKLHAKQRSILHLSGEGGRVYADNESLQLRVVPAKTQDGCVNQGAWVQSSHNATQVLPLCYRWNIQVTSATNTAGPLSVGGVILSSDGSIYGFPADGRTELIHPGQTLTFTGKNETFKAVPPLDTEDQVVVFGTPPDVGIAWHQLTASTRGASSSYLERAIKRFVNTPSRGGSTDTEDGPQEWTRSIVPVRVEANTRFTSGDNNSKPASSREYTISNFDIRPYLPDDTKSALYKVLATMDSLARSSKVDGYSYKQHGWSQGSDIANLILGIDCSRAVWYAFTRSGLPYNDRSDAYLSTADMVTGKTAMQDNFLSCPAGEGYKIGDVLVYRDSKRGDGHVVMVIDPQKRIAWGSHGWDGTPKVMPVEPDTGVEYQKIRVKKDWQRWDRSTMTLRNCWRYKGFSGSEVLGQNAMETACNKAACRL